MSKFKRGFIVASIIFASTLLAKLPHSFTTHSQQTKVTITIYPNENIEDDDNDDQREDNNDHPPLNLFLWLKSLFS